MNSVSDILRQINEDTYDDNKFFYDEMLFKKLHEIYGSADIINKQDIIKAIEALLRSAGIIKKIYLYSFLINITHDKKYVVMLIDTMDNSQEIGLETKYFMYGQIKLMLFLDKFECDIYCKEKIYRFFVNIIDGYKEATSIKLNRISDRNEKLVIVITDQMLAEEHGPTRATIARCIALKKMGKEVLLINTAEMLSKTGGILVYGGSLGNYDETYLQYDRLKWKDVEVQFFQCDDNMPNLEVMEYLIGVISNLRPAYVVNIGGDSVLASLVNEIIPTIAVSMGPSEINITVCDYQTLGRGLNEEDKKYLKLIERDEKRIIKHNFTSDLIEQKEKITKKILGIDEGHFLVAVVGGRLDLEIKEDFVNMMAMAVERDNNISFMIIGDYKSEEENIEKYPILEGRLKVMGFVENLLGHYESCDLYVNPIRKGGGTSSVEALSKGIPVVTVNYGDVAVNVGEEFFTNDYETMVDLIMKYKNDSEFYKMQSEKAKERAEELLDTTKAFSELIDEFLIRVNEEQKR